jgi:hypothetical protein
MHLPFTLTRVMQLRLCFQLERTESNIKKRERETSPEHLLSEPFRSHQLVFQSSESLSGRAICIRDVCVCADVREKVRERDKERERERERERETDRQTDR